MNTFDSVQSALTGRYTLEQELGRGGMATVYLARDVRHDRAVALKVMHPEVATALGAERFLREIRISARLDHPHILTLIDSGQNAGVLWYVLPYVRGESLRAKVAREKQLSVEDVVRIASQVASALDYAHGHGVIHRDIKPENILLHEGEAVVADFGIALALREAGGERLTETGLSLGTPYYMSPEQATGSRELDPRTDVYSLGAVVYEMLTGEPPHTGPTAQAVIAKLLSERPTRVRTVRADVPDHIEAAVMKALAKVPADRFVSASELARALERPGTEPGATRRRRRLATGSAVVGIVILVLAAALAVQHFWQRPAGTAPRGTDVASIAVLPFENLTGNPADAYLSDGMTEEVIGQLAQVPQLKVISRTSSEAIKGARLTLRQIADTLGVRHILEGSVRHAGGRIRVAVDLIDATTDAHVWASSYDRDLTDVFSVQQEIARHVADSLVSTVGVRPSIRGVARTEDPGAYEAYLSGRSLLYQRTPEALRGALDQFERAIAQDSSYAPAYAGRAMVYSYGAPTTTAVSICTRRTAARSRWPTERSRSTRRRLRPTRREASPSPSSGRPPTRSWLTSSGRFGFDPAPRMCTSGTPRSCRGKAAMTRRSRRWSRRSLSTLWLRVSGWATRRSGSPRGATMWRSGKPHGRPR